jgi:hypothetical protein
MSQLQARPTAQAQEFLRHATTYHRFMVGVKWALITLASVIGGLTVAFGAGAGPLWGLIVAFIVFCVGAFAMTHGLAHSSELDNGPPTAAG